MKQAVVCGAGGFIAHHLVRKLKEEGYWVRGVDTKLPEFSESAADEFLLLDLREASNCRQAVAAAGSGPIGEVYQLAADMGGMGFIHSAESEIMRNSALININMIDAATQAQVEKYFLASSVCVYRDMRHGEEELTEEDAYPANPDNEYGWEKLYAERIAFAYGRKFGTQIRVGRFQNTYGPEGTWRGGREKAPAAISRKVAEAPDGGEIEVWGDGNAVRSYTFVDDTVDGVLRLMESGLDVPVNIGSSEYVTVDELVDVILAFSGKDLKVRHVEGPVGVQSRNFSMQRLEGTGWRQQFSLKAGIEATYPWIEDQVRQASVEDRP